MLSKKNCKNQSTTVEKDVYQFFIPSKSTYEIGHHIFQEILEKGALPGGLLYEAGLHVPSKPVISFLKENPQICDIKKLCSLANDLKTCDSINKPILPNFNEILKRAKTYHKQNDVIPIIIIDIDFGTLKNTYQNNLFISSIGSFHLKDWNSYIAHNHIFAYAPIINEITEKKSKFLVDEQFLFTNRVKPTHYTPTVDKIQHKKLKLGESFCIDLNSKIKSIGVQIKLHPFSYDTFNSLEFNVFFRQIPPQNLTWDPIRIVADSGQDTGKSTGITAHVLWSINHNINGPQIQKPIIFLGGFDGDVSCNYPNFYDQIASIDSNDFVTLLRQNYDVVILTYDDVCVSIELNASAFSFTLRDIIDRTSGNDPLVLLSISMGGLVSRLALCGIENGKFNHVDVSLGRGISQHNVKIWVTIDTPHQGAHIPLGLQHLVHGLRYIPVDSVQQVVQLLTSTSAKEMLIDHFESAPGTHPQRAMFLQKLQEWGGFPQNITTTVAVSSGALEYDRCSQAYWTEGNDCSDVPWYQGCVISNNEWAPLIDNVLSLRNNRDGLYYTQSNRGGLFGLRILDLIIDLGVDFGLPLTLNTYVNARAVKWDGYNFTAPEIQEPDADVYKLFLSTEIVSDNVPIELQWIFGLEDPVITSGHRLPSGICYEVYAGSWLNTAETIFTAVSNEFNSAKEPVDNNGKVTYPRIWMPRHSFVPTVSALDISEEFLRAKYWELLKDPVTYFECNEGGNLFPYSAMIRGDFSYVDFIDIAPLLYQSWFNLTNVRPIPSPGK